MAPVKDFSVQEKLVALVRLQKIDSKLDEFATLKGELPMEVSDLEDEIQGLHTRKIKIEEEINGITDYIEQRKESIKDGDALLKKYEKQSENVKNNREFEAINKEIEMAQLDIKLAEKKTISTKEGVLNMKKAELEKIIVETEKEEKVLAAESTQARSAIEERLLYSYDRIRNSYRNGLSVVPVLRDACGGCFNSIPPQKQSEIRQHKKVMVCENCGRILVDSDLHDSVDVK
jgi:uncharacterized protein